MKTQFSLAIALTTVIGIHGHLVADDMAGMDMSGPSATPAVTTPAPAAPATVHQGQGVLKKITEGGKVLVIKHKAIPGYMPAMTMSFELADPALAKDLVVGDRISFTLTKKGNFWPITALHKDGVQASAQAGASHSGVSTTAAP
jgi:Cu/Ag efflux protein CusF